MKHDNGSNPATARPVGKLPAVALLRLRRADRLGLLLGLFACGPLVRAADPGFSSNAPASTSANFIGVLGNPVNVTVTPAGATIYVDMTGGGTFTAKTGTFVLYGSVPARFDAGSFQNLTWSGLTSSNSVHATSNLSQTATVWYKASLAANAGMFQATVQFPVADCLVTYSSSAGGYKYVNRAAQALVWDVLGPVEHRGELELCLMNNSGSKCLLGWGTKMLELAPGMNVIRYDGALGSDGQPLVKPADFQGTFVGGPDGTNYLVGEINSTGTGGISWGTPAPAPWPTNPSTGQDQVRLFPPDVSGGPPSISILHPSGGSQISILPVPLPSTPSNTTGPGASLTDPTKPKPPQSSDNTTNTSTVNNTTNNTSVSNTTIINNDNSTTGDGLTKSEIYANMNAANGLTPDGSVSPDDQGTPGGDLVSAAGGARTGAAGKFGAGSFHVLAAGTIPQVMTMPIEMSFGRFGGIHTSVDFSKQPFPAVRGAVLIATTFGLAIAFMQRVTI